MAKQAEKRSVAALVGTTLAIAAISGAAMAQTAAQKAVSARQAGYKQMGAAFKAINDELKAGSPDTKAITANAAKMRDLSTQAPNWFPRGSGPEAGVKTKAKANIWAEPAKFTTAMASLRTESAKLHTVAASGDVNAIRAQVRAVGASCGGCHKPFREE